METLEQYAEVFNVGMALNSVGGDQEFLSEVVGLMQAAWPTLLTDLRNGITKGDIRAVGTTARLAKAAARNVSAKRAYDSALELETMAGKGDLAAAGEAASSLEHEVEILQFFLANLADENVLCAAA